MRPEATRAELDELVGQLADRVDGEVLVLNDKQRDAMARCCLLIQAAWPECPVQQLDAIKTLHLRAVLELVKVMRAPAASGAPN